MDYEYRNRGVCSRSVRFSLEDGKIRSVSFLGGCSGNTQGVARLIEGMDAKEAADRIRGINCGGKGTSCPDQLARAIDAALAQQQA